MMEDESPLKSLLAPLVKGWVGKIEEARKVRQQWEDVAEQCYLFYSYSSELVWGSKYQKKFNQGLTESNIPESRFRIQLQKAFEMVAVYAPSLFWDYPDRKCTPVEQAWQPLPEFYGVTPEALEAIATGMIDPLMVPGWQQFQLAQSEVNNRRQLAVLRAGLMQNHLDSTPQNQGEGGLAAAGLQAVIDSIVTGRGCLCPEIWKVPGTEQEDEFGQPVPGTGQLSTGSFWESPFRWFIDPNATSATNGYWMARECLAPVWKLSREYGIPEEELKKVASDSRNARGEYQGSTNLAIDQIQGKRSGDTVRYYKVWSKMGPGTRLTDLGRDPQEIGDLLEYVVGDYAYLVIVDGLDYPLNCTPTFMEMATDDDMRTQLRWPIEFWRDRDGWPVQFIDHYPKPDFAWPVSPLEPGIPILIFINFLLSRICEKTWTLTRDIWALAGEFHDEFTKAINSDESTVCAKLPNTGSKRTVADYVQALAQQDVTPNTWHMLEEALVLFERITGVSELLSTGNSGGTQSRTAADARNKAAAAGIRPEWMAKMVNAGMTNIARMESFMSAAALTGQDVAPVLGESGAQLWEQYISDESPVAVMQGMDFTIAASSGRRPDRAKDSEDMNLMLPQLLPVMFQAAQMTGDVSPVNGLLDQWGIAQEKDMSALHLPPLPPPMPPPMPGGPGQGQPSSGPGPSSGGPPN